MKESLLKIKLPSEYKEGLFEYAEGLDNVPEWPELQKEGWTYQEHLKLNKLVSIEHMKYTLKYAIEEDELNEDEINECKSLIERSIEEYNVM